MKNLEKKSLSTSKSTPKKTKTRTIKKDKSKELNLLDTKFIFIDFGKKSKEGGRFI